MSYYHIVIEARENLGKNEEKRDIHLFDITDIRALAEKLIVPYQQSKDIEVDGEVIAHQNIDLLSIKYTQLPILELIKEEQKLLPSHTNITVSAFEIFNDRELSQDVTQVVFDLISVN